MGRARGVRMGIRDLSDPKTEIELQRTQWRLDSMDERLHQGADTFAKMQLAVDRAVAQSQPKPPNPWAVAGKVFGIGVVVAGVAFAAGNYPTRGEWDDSRAKAQHRLDEASKEITEIKIEQKDLSAGIKALNEGQDRAEATQKRIDDKLDKVLSGSNRRKR